MFVHLNVKSDHSILQGVAKSKDYLKAAKKLGYKSLGIANYETLAGSIQFYKEALSIGIKPILGVEVAFSFGSFLFYAKGKEGLFSLSKLISQNRRELNDILSLDNVVVISSFTKSVIDNAEAKDITATLQNKFGNDFYIEINNNSPNDIIKINKCEEFAKEHSINLVATGNVHYIEKEDKYIQNFIRSLGGADQHQFKEDEDLYLKSVEEIKNSFLEYNEAVAASISISEKCNLDLENRGFIFPQFKDENIKLKNLANISLQNRYKENSLANERTEKELEVVCGRGFASYFLLVKDMVDYAKSKNIAIGLGRGSAAGSILAYLLGITEVDPLKYDLMFERFLNIKRSKFPDIDIDIEHERVGEVVYYLKDKYGAVKISTFNRITFKSIVKEVEKFFEVDLSNIKSKLQFTSLKEILSSSEINCRLQKDQSFKRAITALVKLEGNVRSKSIHPAGLIFTDVKFHLPIVDGEVVQYDMDELDYLGFQKIDILSLKHLTIISESLKKISMSRGKKLELSEISLKDKKTYDALHKGKTKYVFQMESTNATNILKKLKPNSIEDLAFALAFNRPGPLKAYGQMDYANIKDEILIYQEQIMKLLSDYVNFDFEDGELFVRAISKKSKSLMDEMKLKFMDRAEELGKDLREAEDIYSKISLFASYSFNKSHAISYALMSYYSSFLKFNYTTEFLASIVDYDSSQIGSLQPYINFIPPDINLSHYNSRIFGNKILLGLRSLKNISEEKIKEIINNRKKNGLYLNIGDLKKRVNILPVSLEFFIYGGIFNSVYGKRDQQYINFMEENSYNPFKKEPIKFLTLNEERAREEKALGFIASSYPSKTSEGVIRLIDNGSMVLAMKDKIVEMQAMEGVQNGDIIEVSRIKYQGSYYPAEVEPSNLILYGVEVDESTIRLELEKTLKENKGESKFILLDKEKRQIVCHKVNISLNLLHKLKKHHLKLEISAQ